MSTQLMLIGDMLVMVEGHLGPRVPSSAEFETGDCPSGSTEEAAVYGAWIIRRKPFGEESRDIGYEVMQQMLEEGGYAWPRPDEDAAAIKKMLATLEAGTITETEFIDWVCLRVATA